MVASTAVTWEDTPGDEAASRRAAEIASLTGLRGFAALMVVLIHTSVLTEFSWLGVPEYGPVSLFVLSGFLLYRPWARWSMRTGRRPSVVDFGRRRLLRIFPAYLVVLAVVSVVYPDDRPEGTWEWVRAMSLTWIYVAEDTLRRSLFQTWSLGTELSWYVALPVLGGVVGLFARRLGPRAGFRLTAALLCLSVPVSFGYRRWVASQDLESSLTLSLWLPAFLFCFAGGALVAHVVEGERSGLVDLTRLRRVAGTGGRCQVSPLPWHCSARPRWPGRTGSRWRPTLSTSCASSARQQWRSSSWWSRSSPPPVPRSTGSSAPRWRTRSDAGRTASTCGTCPSSSCSSATSPSPTVRSDSSGD